jgi:hypothetical protein
MVVEASRKFAPAAGRLEIDTSHELDRFGLDVIKVLKTGKLPDLDGFWKHLEATFGGDAGKAVAFAQAAKAIINGFWLKPDSEIKRTSSAVVLEKRVSSDSRDAVAPGYRDISLFVLLGVQSGYRLTCAQVKDGAISRALPPIVSV